MGVTTRSQSCAHRSASDAARCISRSTRSRLQNHLLLDNEHLGSATTRRRSASLSEGVVEDFGDGPVDLLLAGDIRTCFELSRREAQVQGKGLRIKMRVDDPELAVLPWEYLYDRGQGEFTALSRYTPVVRYIDVPRIMEPLSVAPPLRILGMVASHDLPPLNVERERQRVERAIAPLQAAGRMESTCLRVAHRRSSSAPCDGVPGTSSTSSATDASM